MEWKEQARKRFSNAADAPKWAKIYASGKGVEDLAFRLRRDFTVQYILDNVADRASILDLGCGAGPVLNILKAYKYDLLGVDYSPDMLQLAREAMGEDGAAIPLIRGEVERVPLPDNSWDCVVCLGVISYAVSIQAALGELYRVLKPGGVAIVSYRNYYNPILLDPLKLLLHITIWPYRIFVPEKKQIGRFIRRSEVMAELRKTGLKPVAEHQLGFGPIRLAGKVISDGRLAIKINRVLDKCLGLTKARSLYRAMADIHILIVEKPADAA